MKNRIGVLCILAMIIAPGIVAKALSPLDSTNTITIGQVIGGDSQASVSGSYTLAPGYSFVSITVDAQPTGEGGGEGGEGAGSPDGNGNFTGGAVVPPNATYDVQAYMTIEDSGSNTYYFYSNMVTGVYVPSGPPS